MKALPWLRTVGVAPCTRSNAVFPYPRRGLHCTKKYFGDRVNVSVIRQEDHRPGATSTGRRASPTFVLMLP